MILIVLQMTLNKPRSLWLNTLLFLDFVPKSWSADPFWHEISSF